MANIGTKAGDIIPSGGKLAGEANPNKATVSDFARNYGTYSGADIKVVVHYPQTTDADRSLQTLRAELVQKINEAEKQFNKAMSESYNKIEFDIAISDLDALSEELDSLDIVIKANSNRPSSKTLGEISSFSWSIFRDKAPFRPLGSVYPISYTRGPRSIAGSMVFTIFHEHVFHELLSIGMNSYYNTGTTDFDKYTYTTMLADQLPPLDISLIFANEYGAISHMMFYGVEFFQEGGTFSIEDIYSENVIQYIARDIDPMRIVETREVDGQGITKEWITTASQMLREKQITAHLARRNPFI